MIQTISFHEFQAAFTDMGRESQFSYEAQKALFDYLEQYEDETGEQIELDVIALCCEYQEIEEDEEEYKQYVGDDAKREEFVVAFLPCGVLVREG